jgi:hypothetical protein
MRRRNLASARALALLTVRPVTVTEITELTRFHFSPPLGDGSIVIIDRATDARLIAYVPKTAAQFGGGHRALKWYVRRVGGDRVNRPASRPFATFHAAAEAVQDGTWDLIASEADRRPIRVRYS